GPRAWRKGSTSRVRASSSASVLRGIIGTTITAGVRVPGLMSGPITGIIGTTTIAGNQGPSRQPPAGARDLRDRAAAGGSVFGPALLVSHVEHVFVGELGALLDELEP